MRTASASSSWLKTQTGLSNKPSWMLAGRGGMRPTDGVQPSRQRRRCVEPGQDVAFWISRNARSTATSSATPSRSCLKREPQNVEVAG